MAPFHSGVGIFIFVDNFVVGLNVCGNSALMSFEPIHTIKDTSMSHHVISLNNMHKNYDYTCTFLNIFHRTSHAIWMRSLFALCVL